MPGLLKLAAAQCRTLATTAETLESLEQTVKQAARQDIDIILFPEAYLGGYPRTCDFGSTVGSRTAQGREQFLQYFHDAVDLGDTPSGAGADWLQRRLELPSGKKHRGDGTREELERIARHSGVFVVTGVVERCAGTLYCGTVYVCPQRGIVGKRRKVMPTGTERIVWGQGSPSTLRAVTAEIKGVRVCMAAAICWENYMPLLRQSLYSQNVNLWLAPTADARDTWVSVMRTVAVEGRCVVMSANQCVRKSQLPEWIRAHPIEPRAKEPRTGGPEHGAPGPRRRRSTITTTEDKHEICWPAVEGPSQRDDSLACGQDAFVSRGGSCIVSPFGEVLAGPLWERDNELLVTAVDLEDCERGRLDLDVAGSYGRLDSFRLEVDGLDLSPPP